MLKKALYTYAGGYHPANIKKTWSGNSYWQLAYVFILLPSIILRDVIWKDGIITAIYYILMTFICLAAVAETATPLILQKQMFLCPMREGERKKYVKYLLCFKLLIPTSVMGIIVGIPIYLFGKNLLVFAGVLFSFFSMMLAAILEKAVKGNHSQSGLYTGIYIVSIFLNALLIIFGVVRLSEGGGLPLGTQGYIAVFLVLPLITDILIAKLGIPLAVENAMNYENSMRGKQV